MCAPMMTVGRFKEICQKVYFPVNGYSLADFMVVNGGLFGLLTTATDEQFRKCGLDPAVIPEAIAICDNNVDATILRLNPFLEPSLYNVEALLFGVRMSSHQRPLTRQSIMGTDL